MRVMEAGSRVIPWWVVENGKWKGRRKSFYIFSCNRERKLKNKTKTNGKFVSLLSMRVVSQWSISNTDLSVIRYRTYIRDVISRCGYRVERRAEGFAATRLVH